MYASPLDGMAATQHLRDAVYMSPQLINLTNTLRSKKKCQSGHYGPCTHENHMHMARHVNDATILPESEVVFRAVSPHGHVYWEIDPKKAAEEDDQGIAVTTATSSVTATSRNASAATRTGRRKSPGTRRYPRYSPLRKRKPTNADRRRNDRAGF